MAGGIRKEIIKAHRARWYVYLGGEMIPHQASMRGAWPGWDVICKCGWESRTGGATRGYLRWRLWDHRWSAQCEEDDKESGDG